MIAASNVTQRTNLRCVDWRFLLPDPPAGVFRHLVLLGEREGLAERIVEHGLARRVSCAIPKDRSADAAAIFHNARVSLRDIAGCLVPGGSVYLEIDRRSSGSAASTPGRIRRALRNVGLSPTGIYLVSPDFTRRQAYLPLDIREALKWYVRTFFVAATPALRLLEPALHTLTSVGDRLLPPFVPCYVVTAIAGPIRNARPSVLGNPALPLQLQCSNLRPLLLTPGGDDLNRVVMLVFARRVNQPLGVLKLSRQPARNVLTEDEQVTLTTIRGKLDDAMRRTIPQPMGTVRCGELSVGVESCAPGCLLATSTGRWGVPLRQKIDDLRRAVAWLTDFHSQAQVKRSSWGDAESREWVEAPLSAYDQAFGVTASEKRLFATVRRRADMLMGSVLPTVLVHWNFSASHLFRLEHELTVIDWEGVVPGPPLLDLLYFVMQWSSTVRYLRDDDAQLQGFRDLFCDSKQSDSIFVAAHQAISRYMASLGIDGRFFPLLLVIMCVLRALGRFDRKEGAGERGERARTGNQYVRYLGLLAENVEQLFGDNGK